jgi:hypothetical protein
MECEHCHVTNFRDHLGRRYVLPRAGGLPKIQCSGCSQGEQGLSKEERKIMGRLAFESAMSARGLDRGGKLVRVTVRPQRDENVPLRSESQLNSDYEELKAGLFYEFGITNKYFIT